MRASDRSIDALEYVASDILNIMLRANENGFTAREVLSAVEFILENARIELNHHSICTDRLDAEDTILGDLVH